MNLFSEIINCPNCPRVEVLDSSNEQSIKDHLRTAHNNASANAFIIAVADRLTDDRNRINNTYNLARQYLDSSFASNFLSDFEARCWELSTYQYLVDNGVSINPPSQAAGPDFDTSIGYVECIAVSRGNGPNAVPLMQAAILHADGTWTGEIDAQPVPVNEIQLRISTALAEKIRKYQGYTSQTWFDLNKPRLIALNWFAGGSTFGTSRLDISSNPLLRTLFATGYTQISLNPQTHEVIETRPSHQPMINNANNTPIDMGMFLHAPAVDSDRIDGLIASNAAPFIYDADKYIAVNNPFLSVLDLSTITAGQKVRCTIDATGNSISLNFE